MEKKSIVALTLIVSMMILTGCDATKEQLGALTGGAVGGAAGYGLSRAFGANTTGQILATVAGAAAGAWLGGKIGKQLDERDREVAQQATIQALNAKTPPRKTSAEKTTGIKPVKAAPKKNWKSKHNDDVSGNAQVVADGTNAEGQQCRKVREVAYIRGKEVRQETLFCRDAGGGPWMAQA